MAQESQFQSSVQQPMIDETSKRIIEEKMADRKGKATYERLYELNREKLQKQEQKIKEKFESTQEKKKMTKEERSNLEKTLYEDAERRRYDN